MIRWIQYRFARAKVKSRQKRKRIHENGILKNLSFEQKQIFDLVVSMAKQHPEAIRYDKSAEETIILGTNILITIFEFGKEHLVSIDNHNGFHTQWFYESAFGLLNHKVDVEAHRHRRGLKHEKKMHIRNFLTSVTEQQVENEKSMD